MTKRTVKLGSFALGVNNRLEPTQLSTIMPDRSRGQYLFGAENVDINEKGRAKRRRGQTLRLSGVHHSLWSDARGAFVVRDNTLTHVGAGLAATTIRAAMPELPLSYSRGADGDVYWSNGADLRRVTAGLDDRVAATPAPTSPVFNVASGGSLAAGRYLICCTATSVDGESPASPVYQLDVPAASYISIAVDTEINVYMSAPDGDVLTFQGNGNVYSYSETGRMCETLHTAVMPPGSIVRHFHGRMLVAAGNVLYYSLPYNYGLYDPSAGYIAFPFPITMVEPTDNGVYLAAGVTYWMGEFGESLQVVLPYDAIPYTSGRSPNSTEVFWQSERGLIVATNNMSVKNVQEDALRFSKASSGATLYREQDGMTHIVATRAGAELTQAAAYSFIDAEVIRQGTYL